MKKDEQEPSGERWAWLWTALGLTSLQLIWPTVLNGYRWPWKATWAQTGQVLLESVALHESLLDFAKRPVVTGLIRLLQTLGLGLWLSTTLTALLGVALATYTLQRVAKQVLPNTSSKVPLGLFALTYPVLFAYCSPIYTYDDFFQYAFLFLALLGVLQVRWWAGLAFAAAIVCRDSSVLLGPSLALLVVGLGPLPLKRKLLQAALLALPALLTYVAMVVLLPVDVSQRLAHLTHNFENTPRAVESVFAMLLVCAPALLLALLRTPGGRGERLLVWAALLAMLINTPVVLAATFAREARLFALPLIFLWPITGSLTEGWGRRVRNVFGLKRGWATLTASFVVSYLFLKWAVVPTCHGFYVGFHIYGACLMALGVGLVGPAGKHCCRVDAD